MVLIEPTQSDLQVLEHKELKEWSWKHVKQNFTHHYTKICSEFQLYNTKKVVFEYQV